MQWFTFICITHIVMKIAAFSIAEQNLYYLCSIVDSTVIYIIQKVIVNYCIFISHMHWRAIIYITHTVMKVAALELTFSLSPLSPGLSDSHKSPQFTQSSCSSSIFCNEKNIFHNKITWTSIVIVWYDGKCQKLFFETLDVV